MSEFMLCMYFCLFLGLLQSHKTLFMENINLRAVQRLIFIKANLTTWQKAQPQSDAFATMQVEVRVKLLEMESEEMNAVCKIKEQKREITVLGGQQL